ncbi:MAG: hypothetical protein ACRDPY_01640 [Streptosporangiaceae bacterium]
MFRAVDAVVVNKMDLLPHLDFDLDLFLANQILISVAATRIGAGLRFTLL